jgi:flavin reductase (DIM6/NTAB) family NADH-FMN oxidoreductase RutF
MTRVSVPLRLAYRLLNHGPTTLVTARADGRANVMAAQWVMPIDYDPPKVVAILDRSTFTYSLIARSGTFGLSIPERGQAALTWRVGSTTGAEVDKLATIETFAAETIDAPLVAGCVAWLECRLLRGPALDSVAADHEMFVAEVLAASADERCWRDHHLVLDERHTLHHLGGGHFVASGDAIDGRAA